MQELSLAFVGGCLTHQPGIPFPRLFHRVLSRRLQAHYGRQLKIVVAPRYLDDPHRRLESMLEKGPVDAVVLHRSTMTFFRKTGLIVGVTEEGSFRYVLHPFFCQQGARTWAELEVTRFAECMTLWRRKTVVATPVEGPLPAQGTAQPDVIKERRRLRISDLTWIAGKWAGLVDWAIRDEIRIVEMVRQVAVANNLPLLVLGPGRRIEKTPINQFAARLDTELARSLSRGQGVSYISLMDDQCGNGTDESFDRHHYVDSGHFNEAGHALVATRMEPHLARLLTAARGSLAGGKRGATMRTPE